MLINQRVNVIWAKQNKKYYIEKGYLFSNYGDVFKVKLNDLPMGSHVKVRIRCDYCLEQIFERKYSVHNSIRKISPAAKDNCKECLKYKIQEKVVLERRSFVEIESAFVSKDFTLLSTEDEYTNKRSKLRYICNKHPELGEQMLSWQSLSNPKNKHFCKECLRENKPAHQDKIYKNTNLTQKQLITEVKNEFLSYGYNLLETKYINSVTMMNFICLNHESYGVQQTKLKSVRDKKFGCFVCYVESISGNKSHLWKGGVLENNLLERSSYKNSQWRNDIFKRDNYTCQACGDSSGGNLNAHHIENFSDFEEKRYDVDNGITLCDTCHLPQYEGSFHFIYGTSNNTKDQLSLFIEHKRRHSVQELPISRDYSGKKRSPHSKLTDEEVLEIRRRLENGESQNSLSRVYAVNQKSIGDIYHGRTYKDLL